MAISKLLNNARKSLSCLLTVVGLTPSWSLLIRHFSTIPDVISDSAGGRKASAIEAFIEDVFERPLWSQHSRYGPSSIQLLLFELFLLQGLRQIALLSSQSHVFLYECRIIMGAYFDCYSQHVIVGNLIWTIL